MSIHLLTRAPRLHAPAFAAACLGLTVAFAGSAAAQGRVDAQYEVSLAGIAIGKGAWVVEVAEDQYSASASGRTTGLIAMLGSGDGSGSSIGRIVKGQLAPANYSVTMNTNKRTEVLKIALANGNVKEFTIEPEPPVNPDRIPVTDAHKRGVVDPMTGSLLRVPGNGDPVGPEACSLGQSVFDGRMRYDLKLEYKRMETIKIDKGYQGPAVVCTITFVPIAGYVPDRAAIKYLKSQRNMEVWFAPVLGTRVLMPFRVVIPTPIGTGMLQATRFVNSMPGQAGGPAAARTQ